jgi:hypothetical protein
MPFFTKITSLLASKSIRRGWASLNFLINWQKDLSLDVNSPDFKFFCKGFLINVFQQAWPTKSPVHFNCAIYDYLADCIFNFHKQSVSAP